MPQALFNLLQLNVSLRTLIWHEGPGRERATIQPHEHSSSPPLITFSPHFGLLSLHFLCYMLSNLRQTMHKLPSAVHIFQMVSA